MTWNWPIPNPVHSPAVSFLFFMWFPFLFFPCGVSSFVLCLYIRTEQQRTGILPVPFRERSGGRHVKNIHVDTGEVKKSDWSAQSKANLWRVSLRIFFLLLRIMRLVSILTDSFSYFSLVNYSAAAEPGGNFWLFLLKELNKTLGLEFNFANSLGYCLSCSSTLNDLGIHVDFTFGRCISFRGEQ